MKLNRFSHLAAGAACLVSIGLGATISAGAAHAAPTKPLCKYEVGTGTAADDISRLKCTNPDGTFSRAIWVAAASELTLGSADVAVMDSPSTRPGDWDAWYFDPRLVSFEDLKKELSRTWGYTQVFLDYAPSDDRGYVSANWDLPSKKKF